MSANHTPRSSFTEQRPPQRTTFFDLPSEIRIEIYKLVFANMEPRPLRIEHRPKYGWALYNGLNYHYLFSPATSLLQTSKRFYLDAVPTLHRLCRHGPTLVIGVGQKSFYEKDIRWELLRQGRSLQLSRVRDALPPILRGARQRLTLEVVVPHDPGEQVLTIAFLKWMRAVVNTAPSHPVYGDSDSRPRVRELRVIFHTHGRAHSPAPGVGIYDVFRGWRCCNVEAEVVRKGVWPDDGAWTTQWMTPQGPTQKQSCKSVMMSAPAEGGADMERSEEEAWRDSEAARVQATEKWAWRAAVASFMLEPVKLSDMLRWAQG
ncbi:uncharacterized protein LTR77_000440 [Saxophila tyrrhenica]|uniref:Uncharacterized protein n=1 Tax=Saxophila tyrrhenica TaxID=1690608 RepID=A0AAV9PR59_9PEZI|nr:hypothetical protein LTR77_000440 [Saxophila tyrrhenica]